MRIFSINIGGDVATGATTVSIGSVITGGTQGSVLFIGAGSQLSQNNVNFSWDDTNNRLKIGGGATPLFGGGSLALGVGMLANSVTSGEANVAAFGNDGVGNFRLKMFTEPSPAGISGLVGHRLVLLAGTPHFAFIYGNSVCYSMSSVGNLFLNRGAGPTAYNAAARLHLDSGTATASTIKLTAGTTTGQTSSDGFDLGIDSSANAEIRNREDTALIFYQNNTDRGRFSVTNGNLLVGTATEGGGTGWQSKIVSLFTETVAGAANAMASNLARVTIPSTVSAVGGQKHAFYSIIDRNTAGNTVTDTATIYGYRITNRLISTVGASYTNTSANGVGGIYIDAFQNSGALGQYQADISSYNAIRIATDAYPTGPFKCGINIGSITGASTNFSIQTGLGLARFGDVVQMRQGMDIAYASTSTNLTLGASHCAVVADATGGTVTITLPSGVTTLIGRRYLIKKIDASANTVLVAAFSGETIDGAASVPLTTQYARTSVVAAGATSTGWWVI